jgi:hypothetical protein
MTHDDPNLTAYILGELDGTYSLDPSARAIADQTALIASILTTHLRKPPRRRRRRFLPQAIIACLLLLLICSPARQLIVTQTPEDSIAQTQNNSRILHLTPTIAPAPEPSVFASTHLTGNRAVDVDQLVAAVLEDASRVGSFSSLRLVADPISFQ